MHRIYVDQPEASRWERLRRLGRAVKLFNSHYDDVPSRTVAFYLSSSYQGISVKCISFLPPPVFCPINFIMPSTETEALEKTPLLDSERRSRHGKNSLTRYTLKRHHSPNSSINSQLESGPSCSRSPIYRRCCSAESLSSSSAGKESNERTSSESDSPNLQCIYPQQNQPLLSRSGPFCNVRKWVVLRLENSGSVARDHLASERTFLAYVRTSLAIASSGVALVQLFSTASESEKSWQKLHVYVRPLGASAVICGLLVLFIGFTRYFTIQAALTKGVFPVARLATGFVAMMLGVLMTLTFGILLAGKMEQK